MQLIKISPRGFCSGVINAFAIAKNVARANPGKKIYMLGWLVHNEHVVAQMRGLGITVLDDRQKDRKTLVEQIDPAGEPIVIFSAHGTDHRVIELARRRNLRVVDVTCVYVTKTHDLIKEKLAAGHQILYIGVANHPETASALALSDKIVLLQTPEDAKNLSLRDERLFVTNQTTISIYEFYGVIKQLRKKYANIEFRNDICNATNERQEALMNAADGLDLVLVVGDPRSNNSLKLVEIAKARGIEAHLVPAAGDLRDDWFAGKARVGLTSGASTPDEITQAVIDAITAKYAPEVVG